MTPGFPPRHSERREWDGETERPRWDRETDRGRRVRIRSRASPGRPDPPLGTGPPPGAGRGARPWGGGSFGLVSSPARPRAPSLTRWPLVPSTSLPAASLPRGLAPQGLSSPLPPAPSLGSRQRARGARRQPGAGRVPGVRAGGDPGTVDSWPGPRGRARARDMGRAGQGVLGTRAGDPAGGLVCDGARWVLRPVFLPPFLCSV